VKHAARRRRRAESRVSSSSEDAKFSGDEEPTLFDLAKEEGLLDTIDAYDEELEAAVSPVGPPPRPPLFRSFPTDIDKVLARYRDRQNREENMIRIKDDNKAVSLGTSKINYIDPRIVCSWAKEQGVPINKLFSATILKKFPWAVGVENFDF